MTHPAVDHYCAGFAQPLERLLARYGLQCAWIAADAEIPGTYWGAPEAGIIGPTVFLRNDTPLHSALHEAAHLICMDPGRRAHLHTDAGGEYAEEDAVCYLQIVLAQALGVGPEALCADMDAWGYTFRLGSALRWYREDAADARAWLLRAALITPAGAPTYALHA